MTGDDKPRSRRLTDHEHALWRGITRSIKPLKRRRLVSETDAVAAAEKKSKPAVTRAPTAAAHRAPFLPPWMQQVRTFALA